MQDYCIEFRMMKILALKFIVLKQIRRFREWCDHVFPHMNYEEHVQWLPCEQG